MGGAISLQGIMNDVCHRLDSCGPAQPEALSELQAFARLDPVLGSLQKQYLDAKQLRLIAEAEFGRKDDMTSMAALAEDSAWCAMQTRYMEVRTDRAMMVEAQALMRDAACKAEHRKKIEKEKRAQAAYEQMQQALRQQKEKDEADIWLWALAMMSTELGIVRPMLSFNRIAA